MNLKLAFSSCPNDTFMFDAMIHKKIDTEGLEFDVFIADIEELNQQAFAEIHDLTKLSFHAYASIYNKYQWLTSGSALGRNNGPLLISKHKIYPDELNDIKIAIPGINTTANLLMSIAFPQAKNKTEYLFSDIEEAVLSNEMDAGLIIHESRFTYQKKGLKKIIDLGEYWETETDMPIPLGGIVIKRELSQETKNKVNRVLKKSVEFAFKNPESSYKFVKKHAQELNDEVIRNHINLYVNKYSIELGKDGKNAIQKLFDLAFEKGIISKIDLPLFVE